MNRPAERKLGPNTSIQIDGITKNKGVINPKAVNLLFLFRELSVLVGLLIVIFDNVEVIHATEIVIKENTESNK